MAKKPKSTPKTSMMKSKSEMTKPKVSKSSMMKSKTSMKPPKGAC